MTRHLLPTQRLAANRRKDKPGLWFERLMAIVALINLGLVAFNYSYIPWRDAYRKVMPEITEWYGAQFKGIEPHRFTETYLRKVTELEQQVAATGLQSPEVGDRLAQLRALSAEMIDENPFEGAGKTGTLEQIKHRMRARIGTDSSKQAFDTFWSEAYLSQVGWPEAMQFFDRSIRPRMQSNYYRNIGENGEPVDRFWQIDSWFIALFGIEFLARTFYLSRRYKQVSWLDTIVWRWYDLPLLLPFWRWLRVISVSVRLDQAKLVNFNPLRMRIVHTFVSGIAVELTEMVIIRILDQTQEAIEQGDVTRWLLDSSFGRHYIDINGVNEIELISQHLTTILVDRVLPNLKPEIDALLHHSVTSVLNSAPAYARLQQWPGVRDWSNQLTQQIVAETSTNVHHLLKMALSDQQGAQLMQNLISRLGEVARSEIRQDQALAEIESLTVALLDEIKVNYAQRIATEDLEKLKADSKRIYELMQSKNP